MPLTIKMENSIFNESTSLRVFQQFMDLYIIPEIERRQKASLCIKPLDLRAAQIIFMPHKNKTVIRINSEVQTKAKLKLKKGISKEKGEGIYEHEVEGIEFIHLPEDVDPDSGHAALIRVENTWFIYWDFTYNKVLSKKHLENAKQFIESSDDCLNRNNIDAFIENLFSASELIVKSILLGVPDKKFREKATHRIIHSRFNQWARLGNAKPEYRKAFNKIASLRPKARYLKGDFSITEQEAQELLETVKNMYDEAILKIKRD